MRSRHVVHARTQNGDRTETERRQNGDRTETERRQKGDSAARLAGALFAHHEFISHHVSIRWFP